MFELTGYGNKFSVKQGESIDFMISTDAAQYEAALVRLIHADSNPQGPGFKQEAIESLINRQYAGRKQIAHTGSYVVVPHHAALSGLAALTLQAWIYPTTPQNGITQGIIGKWSQADGQGYGLGIGSGGALEFWIGSAQHGVRRVSTGAKLRGSQWYFVAATFDSGTGHVALYQFPVADWPSAADTVMVAQSVVSGPLSSPAPVLIAAAYGETDRNGRVIGRGLYNGKIDRPRIFGRALTQGEIVALSKGADPGSDVLAAWDFSADIASSRIHDSGPHGLHGTAINMPMRAVTGYNWTHATEKAADAPEQYGAISFHDDDLEDARWEADFTLTVPPTLKSGIYAIHLRSGEHEDHIPFFVRPAKSTAPIAFLAPTLTYLAYANQRIEITPYHAIGITERELHLDPLDHFLAEHPEYGKSIYDLHSDGSGVVYSSRLRPIISMRPQYRYWLVAAPRHLPADLYLIDWLEQKQFDYDVLTDEDLHHEGQTLLDPYRVIITGSHPEYWTDAMLAAMRQYLSDGGRLMYLGGNGFYWVTGLDAERPQMMEVRRGYGGSRDSNTAPGEYHLSTTGEMGGIWRHRGQAPNQLTGVGFGGMGWDGIAPGYVRKAGSFDPRVAFIFDGIGVNEVIGNFGLVIGGSAGDELDRLDYALGTPPHALLLASSEGHNQHVFPVIEDYTQINAELAASLGNSPNVHADMVYFETANGGEVFSTGSITWIGSLSHANYQNNVSRITENVLRRFSRSER